MPQVQIGVVFLRGKSSMIIIFFSIVTGIVILASKFDFDQSTALVEIHNRGTFTYKIKSYLLEVYMRF